MTLKNVLIVFSGTTFFLIHELPFLLKKGGLHVTLISSSHWSICHNPAIDEWIEAPCDSKKALQKAIELIQSSKKKFDCILLGTDALVWEVSQNFPKAEPLSPIANRQYRSILEGKIGVFTFCQQRGIPFPPSRIGHSLEEIKKSAEDLGFPVLLKISKSGGGEGVYKCHSFQELEKAYRKIPPQELLIQKWIEGEAISVEPLFIHSHLLAYNYSIMTETPQPFSESIARIFKPNMEVLPLLQKIGQELKPTGFFNMTFIHEKTTGKHYLIELDFRPNKWIGCAPWVGVDWSRALMHYRGKSPEIIETPKQTKRIRHFASDVRYALFYQNYKVMGYWLFNREGCWKTIPFHHWKWFFYGSLGLLRMIFFTMRGSHIFSKKKPLPVERR